MQKEKFSKRLGRSIAPLIILFLLIGVIFICSYIYFHGPDKLPIDIIPERTTAATTEPKKEDKLINPLTGEEGLSEEAYNKRPVSVMISNISYARPQWGLCSPDIVMEGLAEGGITRMLWLYSDPEKIPQVGSIRSARHDFVELAESFDSIFVHWGGSKYAYDALDRRDVDDIDGYVSHYFFRDTSRYVDSEHRGCTNSENIIKAISDYGYRTDINSKYSSPFLFNEEAVKPQTVCNSVDFSYSGAAEYKFTFEDGKYYCRLNGDVMTQDGGEQFAVTNVILLYCSVSSLGDSAGCVDMDLTSGKGLYISNGGCEEITWEKGMPSDPIKLYTAEKNSLSVNVGKSYIGFVPSNRQSQTKIS